jgi:hypothetical protein
MDNTNNMEKIMEKFKKFEAEFVEYKKFTESVILVNTALVQEIADNIDIKLDILCNLDTRNSTANKAQVKKTKVVSKLAFFKNKLKKNINEYIDVLYTEDEINDLYSLDDVKVKKTELLKKNRIIDLLYVNITKNDAQKNIKLKNIYDEYKLDFEKEESLDDDVDDVDDESKNND